MNLNRLESVMLPEKHEINRKLLHLAALLLPFSIFYTPHLISVSKWFAPLSTGLLFFAAFLVDKCRLTVPSAGRLFFSIFGKMLRTNEQSRLTGATYICAGAFLCALIFVQSPHISFVSLTLFILGDAAASLIGQRFGRIALFGKTLEGSISCFLLCFFLMWVVIPRLPYVPDAFGGKILFPVTVLTALAVAVLELIPIKISDRIQLNDNLIVPVLTGLVLFLLTRASA